MPMRPPTVTHHDKQLHTFMRDGKPCAVLHDTPELKDARAACGFLDVSFRGAPPWQLENHQAGHRQLGKSPEGRDDPPALLA